MNIILDKMQDGAESSCLDEKDESDVQIAFTSQPDVMCYETTADFLDIKPPFKRARISRMLTTREAIIVRQLVIGIQKAVCNRLDVIDEKLEAICINSKYFEDKLEQMVQNVTQNCDPNCGSENRFDVGSNSDCVKQEFRLEEISAPGDMQRCKVITLNREEDYPDGSWLGDENKPEMRVRVAISSQDLLHMNSNCQTPMKMALTLLDYLFDRDTLASSNLSGHSKHGKKQLNPLLIYGIRCHLIHRFGITEDDWKHVKQNMDSKCRTAFRRKMLGMPLTVKAFRGKVPSVPNSDTMNSEFMSTEDSFQHTDSEVIATEDMNISQLMMMGTENQKIQLIHATPEQLSQLNIKIIRDGQIVDLSGSGAGMELFSRDAGDEVVCFVKSEIDDEH